ncbi:hypothetical protein Cst_c03900 [Thermoclostridium stercorarium subsp. stercorarium DSM 8532]|uniref:Uncharacterized protein n=1 Tax=Thermoclostridium stercorarium (strain ATCC 35414 / DSM 8532 / NCIMB 11754) TaxID=1121335 RepID=L7VKY7_THES1|nr:hypothetical protein [Thermoclostridium stercorarium]AGC67412.1 hypothetical protein Cst_c03900 [Thermoclostridium stercorarium subsp. stercorarium DSM 8532]AGI38474.1 hypothetical protein Clst_0373 [Thermoclostridium stercorarium subsp. stercorarium DSM 8532]
MYEIPWLGIIGVLVGFVVASILYIRTYEKLHKKNQRGSIDLTKLVVTEKKTPDKNIKLM